VLDLADQNMYQEKFQRPRLSEPGPRALGATAPSRK
jgi:hypothetical protein